MSALLRDLFIYDDMPTIYGWEYAFPFVIVPNGYVYHITWQQTKWKLALPIKFHIECNFTIERTSMITGNQAFESFCLVVVYHGEYA